MDSSNVEFQFLDLDSCSSEDKDFLNSILKVDEPAKAANPPKLASSLIECEPPFAAQNHHQQQQQQQQQPHHPPPPFDVPTVSDYTSTASNHSFPTYSAPGPCVFINNVTANVNVHHGPAAHHLQQDDQHHNHHQQPPLMQPRFQHQGPPPMPGYPAPPQPHLLPTPQFGPQQPAFSQFAVNQPGIGGTKQAYPIPQTMFAGSPYSNFMYMSTPYGYSVVPVIAQVPQTHPQPGIPRAAAPMVRGQAPIPVFNAAPPVPEMAGFPAPPPLPVTTAPISNEIPVEPVQQQQQQPQVLLPPPQQRHHVAVSIEEEIENGSGEVKPDTEEDEELVEKFETASFGFEVPDEVFENENSTEDGAVVDVNDRNVDVPTPLQDEIENNEELPTQQDEQFAQAEQHEQQEQFEESKPPVQKSWASLFHSDSKSSLDGGRSAKPTAMIHPYTSGSDKSGASGPNAMKNDSVSSVSLGKRESEMAAFLKAYVLNHKAQSLKPRGLSNRSNWCFVNAIMQALVACPPFYNLMKSLPDEVLRGDLSEMLNSPLKILSSVNAFVSEFGPLENFPRMNRKSKKQEDLPLGKTFEAASIFNMLLNLKSDTFKVIEGRQEDAEEFLTFLLNGLNDEMIAILKLLNGNDVDASKNDVDAGVGNVDMLAEDDDDFNWKEVGPKKKSCATRRGAAFKTPLSEIFQGQVRSCVTRTVGDATATLQPFFTLQLDIQSDLIKNVSDALAHNFASETLEDYVCSKTKQEIEASRLTLLEELPPVLILHLKRFVYNGTSGGCQKLLKNIDFPVDLEIAKDILSPSTRNKYVPRQRLYKLFAVVYHNGTEATKGHYVADVYHSGLSTWLHCDDSTLKPMSENMVTAHSASSLPYILFYRRGDTMGGGGGEKLKDKSGSKLSASGVQ